MRFALLGLALIVLVPAGIEPAGAQPRAYCLTTGSGGPGDGVPDCTYHTLQQCMAARGGGNDGCYANPALGWDRIDGGRQQPPRRASRDR